MYHHTNIVRLRVVASVLEEWKDKIVFVGGATVSLYASRPLAVAVRVTADLEIVVELVSTADFYKMQERLLELGFKHDTTAPIISRFLYQGLKVDFMPTDPSILGFSNRWYVDGVKYSLSHQLTENQQIRIFPSSYFIASKMEAFKTRGKGDLFGSHDLEDIIFILDNRDEISQELMNANAEVKAYLQKEFLLLLKESLFEEALLGNVEQADQMFRKNRVMEILVDFTNV